jgi:alkylation response protein AidB-like acyl-CoA dehydrogenase
VNFALSDEQIELQRSARQILTAECPMTRVRKIAGSPAGLDPDLQRVFAEAGWLGILVPESLGGAGLGLLDAAVLLHELGRAVAPGPFIVSSIGAVVALRAAGTRAQQEAWLPRIASGDAIATLAIAEGEEPRFDGPGIQARAARAAGGATLSGIKMFVEYAHVADLLLSAFRAGKPSGEDGLGGVGLFAVPGRAKGLSVVPLVSIDETRRPCEARFRNVRVPISDVLSGAGTKRSGGDAPRGLRRAMDACAIAIAAESLGGAERALEGAVEYVKVREQFGRPVGSFQAVQHMAADALAQVEPARSLLWYAAWAFDARPKEAPLAAAMAKALCTDVYREVSRAAIEMHGGIGFTWEHDMHFWFKRALSNASAFGDAAFHRERVARLSGF